MKIAEKDKVFVASSVLAALLLMLIIFLTYVPLPSENKDLIVSILSMFVGAGATALSSLVGKKDDKELQEQIDELKKSLLETEAKYSATKDLLDHLLLQMAEKLQFDVKQKI